MSDIFISYAREDRETAHRLANALEAQGWSVWWDTRLNAGEVWDEVIERESAAARCVIALWSKASVQSYWVREEARKGSERGILVPVWIENVQLPLPFRRIPAVDLIGWKGQREHPGFQRLMADVTGIIRPRWLARAPADALEEPPTPMAPPPAWEVPDFDRVLAPDSFPTALAAAIALREREVFRKTAMPPPMLSPPHRSILLK